MLENLELNGYLNAYVNVSDKLDQLTAQKDELKDKILEMLGTEAADYDNGFIKAKVTTAVSNKYPDTLTTIATLKSNNGEKFVEEAIDTKALNAYIKKNPDSDLTKILKEKNLITSTTTVKLSVSKY